MAEPTTRHTNDLLMLSDAHEEIRKLLAGETINKLMMERKYFDLCLTMAQIARLAHTCNGIYFGLHIKAGAPVSQAITTVTDKNHLVYDDVMADQPTKEQVNKVYNEVKDKLQT